MFRKKTRFRFTVLVPATYSRTQRIVATSREEADGMFHRLYGYVPTDRDYLWVERDR